MFSGSQQDGTTPVVLQSPAEEISGIVANQQQTSDE
jgi:hypothetical protein